MKFTRSGSVQVVAGLIVGVSALVVACGGDDSTGVTTPADGGSTSSGGSSGVTSSSGGSSGGSSGTTSSSGSTTDGGGDGGGDAGGEGGAKKANGEACTAPSECQSGECFIGNKESYCTIKCTMTEQTDPVCTALGAAFSGTCNKKGYCQKK